FVRIATVLQHPRADVAILRVGRHEPAQLEPFWNYVANWGLGEDFMAYGYPMDVLGPNSAAPTARLFKGHYQRFMEFASVLHPYRYLAGEMSIAAPAGLSRGPLFRAAAPVMVTALVAENAASSLVVDSIEGRSR